VKEMPPGWWLTHPSAHYLLAALVHKTNPDIAVDPVTVAAGGTREDQRKQVRDDRVKERGMYPTFASTKRGELEESMMDTKAKLMKSNIDIQETECIQKQLALLKEFKSSAFNNEEDEYDSAVRDLINELPLMKKRKGLAAAEKRATEM